jgi:hypothetical protein
MAKVNMNVCTHIVILNKDISAMVDTVQSEIYHDKSL